MSYKDTSLLQEAYLSVLKKRTNTPSQGEGITADDMSVDTSPVKEIAPGVDLDKHYSDEEDFSSEENDTTGTPVSIEFDGDGGSKMDGDVRFSVNDEDEEDDMTVDNIHSIKESLMKIAMAVAAGVHLEPWQQFKVAIVMDNLASVARSLPRQQHNCGY